MKSIFILISLGLPLSAAVSVNLPGGTENASWILNSTNYGAPSFPTSFPTAGNAWAGPALPGSGTASALLDKVSGGGAFYATYLYTSGVTGAFHIYDASPQASLQTIVFQGNMSADVLPLLNYNGGTQSIAATYFYLADNATGYDDYVYQWDLSGVAGAITSYDIQFGAHFAATSFSINTGDSFSQVVPEPSSALLGAAALGLTFIRRRRA
jgi:hypothetical protein